MNAQVLIAIASALAPLDKALVDALQILLDNNVFAGPLARFKPWIQEVQTILKLFTVTSTMELPPPPAE